MIHDALVPEPVPVQALEDELDSLQVPSEAKFVCLTNVFCLKMRSARHWLTFDNLSDAKAYAESV